MKNEQLPILNTSEFYWYVLTTIGAGPGTVFPHVPAVAIAVLLGVKVAFVNAICTISSDFFCNGLGYVRCVKIGMKSYVAFCHWVTNTYFLKPQPERQTTTGTSQYDKQTEGPTVRWTVKQTDPDANKWTDKQLGRLRNSWTGTDIHTANEPQEQLENCIFLPFTHPDRS